MATRMTEGFDFGSRRSRKAMTSTTIRSKMVWVILDAWGTRVIKEFAYADKAKAEAALKHYHAAGRTSYYLQQRKVPM